jgi:hypothetical protein
MAVKEKISTAVSQGIDAALSTIKNNETWLYAGGLAASTLIAVSRQAGVRITTVALSLALASSTAKALVDQNHSHDRFLDSLAWHLFGATPAFLLTGSALGGLFTGIAPTVTYLSGSAATGAQALKIALQGGLGISVGLMAYSGYAGAKAYQNQNPQFGGYHMVDMMTASVAAIALGSALAAKSPAAAKSFTRMSDQEIWNLFDTQPKPGTPHAPAARMSSASPHSPLGGRPIQPEWLGYDAAKAFAQGGNRGGGSSHPVRPSQPSGGAPSLAVQAKAHGVMGLKGSGGVQGQAGSASASLATPSAVMVPPMMAPTTMVPVTEVEFGIRDLIAKRLVQNERERKQALEHWQEATRRALVRSNGRSPKPYDVYREYLSLIAALTTDATNLRRSYAADHDRGAQDSSSDAGQSESSFGGSDEEEIRYAPVSAYAKEQGADLTRLIEHDAWTTLVTEAVSLGDNWYTWSGELFRTTAPLEGAAPGEVMLEEYVSSSWDLGEKAILAFIRRGNKFGRCKTLSVKLDEARVI